MKGEYGATPVEVDKALQARVLDGEEPIVCRPRHVVFRVLSFRKRANGEGGKIKFTFSENIEDDVLTYALFPQVELSFSKIGTILRLSKIPQN